MLSHAQLRSLTVFGALALSFSAAAQSAPASGANGAPSTASATAGSVNTAGQAKPILRSSGHRVIVPVPPEQQDTATPRPTVTR
jgi:hypothetical protein